MGAIMKVEEFRDRLAGGAITRRQAAAVMASAGVGMATVTLRPGRALAQEGLPVDDQLLAFEWSGYELPQFFGSYTDKYGTQPSYTFFGEEEEALQKIRAGFTPDISHPCTYSTRRWRDAGILKPIDTARLSNWGDVFTSLKTLPGSQDESGQDWFVPADWGNSSVLFRPDLAPEYVDADGEKNESWMILFDEKYAGRLGIFDSVDGVMAVVGSVIGAENVFDMTDEELDRAIEMMRKQREVLRFYWTDASMVEQGLASGELVASYAWNSAVRTLKDQGVNVTYMNPKEGIWTWVCGFVLMAEARGDEDKAYDYIDAWIAPESGKYLIEEYGYGHSNTRAFELVSAEALQERGLSDPETMMASSRFFGEIAPDVREKYVALFEEIKAGF